MLVPNASFHGHLGDGSKEPLFVYVMNRIQGISYLDFVLANGFPENSDKNFVWRKTLMADVHGIVILPYFLMLRIVLQRCLYIFLMESTN